MKPAGLDPEYQPGHVDDDVGVDARVDADRAVGADRCRDVVRRRPRWLAMKLTLDANGRGVPHGQTVAKPGPAGWTMVTFNATADASAGTAWDTPPTSRVAPRTGIAIGVVGVTLPARPPVPSRVSTYRFGIAPTNAAGCPSPAGSNQPSRSTTTSAGAIECRQIDPSAPTGATTPLATNWPGEVVDVGRQRSRGAARPDGEVSGGAGAHGGDVHDNRGDARWDRRHGAVGSVRRAPGDPDRAAGEPSTTGPSAATRAVSRVDEPLRHRAHVAGGTGAGWSTEPTGDVDDDVATGTGVDARLAVGADGCDHTVGDDGSCHEVHVGRHGSLGAARPDGEPAGRVRRDRGDVQGDGGRPRRHDGARARGCRERFTDDGNLHLSRGSSRCDGVAAAARSHIENLALPVAVRCTPSVANHRERSDVALAAFQSAMVRLPHRDAAAFRAALEAA